MDEILFNTTLKNGFKQLKLSRIMSKPAHTVRETADLSRVEKEFIEKKIRHIPVVDEKGRLMGIISQRDLYRTIAPRKNEQGQTHYAKDLLVEDDECFYDRQTLDEYILYRVMHKDPESLTPDDSVKDAIHLMVRKKIGCIPILNERGEVVGIVTRHDILKTLEKILSETAQSNN